MNSGPRTISIVVVDDHPVVRDGIRGMLEREPDMAVVGEASSGDEALARIAAATPDVVLMDLRMPGSDGVDAIRAVSYTHLTLPTIYSV